LKIKIALACLFLAGLYATARLTHKLLRTKLSLRPLGKQLQATMKGRKGFKEIVHVAITRRRNCLLGKYERSPGRCA
jgi:hypothetical protein